MEITPELDAIAFLLALLGFLVSLPVTFATRNGRFRPNLRRLSAYDALSQQIGAAIESGGRVHISLASNSITEDDTGTTIAGLGMLRAVSEQAAISDQPPLATTSDPTTLPLIRDVMRNAANRQGMPQNYSNSAAQMVALDPLTMAAGLTSLIPDEGVTSNILIGSFEDEAILITEAGARRNISQTVASDRLEGQAVAYAAADHPLIGEELFVSEAYLSNKPSRIGSLVAQDFLRWIVIISIIAGVFLKTMEALN